MPTDIDMDTQTAAKAVSAALEREPDINLHAFPITVREEAGTLRLEGEVENIVAKRKAWRIARDAASPADVLDDLYVRPGEVRGDDELRVAVLDALQREPVFRGLHIAGGGPATQPADIAVAVADGRVSLAGTLRSLSHRRLAEVLAWWTPGVRDVHNRLHVQPAEHDHDGEITDAIRIVLDKETALDGNEIRVETVHAAVTLTGSVRSETLKTIAGFDCWYVPGVHSVDNRLEVRPG